MMTDEQKKNLIEILRGCACEFVGNSRSGLPVGFFEREWQEYLAKLVDADLIQRGGEIKDSHARGPHHIGMRSRKYEA